MKVKKKKSDCKYKIQLLIKNECLYSLYIIILKFTKINYCTNIEEGFKIV